MYCGLPLGAFGLLLSGVPPSVDPEVYARVLLEFDSLPHGGVSSSSTIVATKSKVFSL